MATQKDWTVTEISRCNRTGSYTLRGLNNLAGGESFSWYLRWTELAKDHSRFDFSETVWEGAAWDWAYKCGHKFPGLATALVRGLHGNVCRQVPMCS